MILMKTIGYTCHPEVIGRVAELFPVTERGHRIVLIAGRPASDSHTVLLPNRALENLKHEVTHRLLHRQLGRKRP